MPPVSTIAVASWLAPVLRAWSSIATQWRVGMGGAVGLDYAGAKIALDALGIDLDADLMADIQTMESAALSAMRSA